MDVMRQVGADRLYGEAEARRPRLRDGFEIFRRHSMIARLLEGLRDRRRYRNSGSKMDPL